MLNRETVIHLSSITRKGSEAGVFPFIVPAIGTLRSLEFSTAVTFFVGENGTWHTRTSTTCG